MYNAYQNSYKKYQIFKIAYQIRKYQIAVCRPGVIILCQGLNGLPRLDRVKREDEDPAASPGLIGLSAKTRILRHPMSFCLGWRWIRSNKAEGI